jgi:hypothetical protein
MTFLLSKETDHYRWKHWKGSDDIGHSVVENFTISLASVPVLKTAEASDEHVIHCDDESDSTVVIVVIVALWICCCHFYVAVDCNIFNFFCILSVGHSA